MVLEGWTFLKLGCNSCYGKLAQSVGHDRWVEVETGFHPWDIKWIEIFSSEWHEWFVRDFFV